MFLVPKHSNTIIIVLLSIVLIYSLGLCLQIKCKQVICCKLFSVVKIEKKIVGTKKIFIISFQARKILSNSARRFDRILIVFIACGQRLFLSVRSNLQEHHEFVRVPHR